jgi:hypothetical protein
VARGLTQPELRAAIAQAVRNRDKYALKAKDLLQQGKSDHAAVMLARADNWELERKKLERVLRERNRK